MFRMIAFVFLLAFTSQGPAFAETTKHILVFGDSNSWGWTPVSTGFPTVRLDTSKSWPGVMEKSLGASYSVSVDALSGRTVDVDYPAALGSVPGTGFNGKTALPAAIAREMPLDLIVIMLGTNDVRSDLNRSPEQIAAGLRQLTELVAASAGGVFTSYPAPKVLIVVPPAVADTSRTPINQVMAGASAKSLALPAAVRAALQGTNAAVLDGTKVVTVHGIDGVHLNEADHAVLGKALAEDVRRVLEEK